MEITDKFLNQGVRSFGLEPVCAKLKEFVACYGITCVSVGSGMGALEYASGLNVLCVDPKPTAWLGHGRREPFLAPRYAYVQDLVQKEPQLVNNCVLLLNWACPNDSDYDYQAVQLLQPVAILTLIEVYCGGNGAAGGKKFFDSYVRENLDYLLVQNWNLDKHDESTEHKDMRLLWLQKSGSCKTPALPILEKEITTLCQIAHHSACIIA